MFIGDPDPHPFSTSHGQALELGTKRLLKLAGGDRVFVGVSLARYLQDSAQFSQPVIHAAQAHRRAMPLRQPLLNLFGALPPALSQPHLHLGQQAPLHLGRRPTTMPPSRQLLHPAGFQGADPVKELPPTDADLRRDLGGG